MRVTESRARVELRATGATPRRRSDDANRDQLTPHEIQVALTVAGGASNRDAAAALFLSPKTVDTYRARLMQKLGLSHRSELVRLALQTGLLKPV